MTTTDKVVPVDLLREPLPPIYPVAVIEAACHALDVLSQLSSDASTPVGAAARLHVNDTKAIALRIIRDGLLSHEREITAGRSRG